MVAKKKAAVKSNAKRKRGHHMIGRAHARLGDSNRCKSIVIRCTEDEHAAIIAAAQSETNGVMGDYIRYYVPAFEQSDLIDQI